MTPHQKRILSPITQRMAGDMLVRNLAQRTIDTYTYHVERFSKHFDRPLDQLGPEEIRGYQLHLIEVKKASWSTFNQAVCSLRFLYHVTLPRPWVVQHIPYGKRPKLPGVEFTRRWSLHILPKGFVKSRGFGGYSGRTRAAYLDRCRALLRLERISSEPSEVEPCELGEERESSLRCPQCQTVMHCISDVERPGWNEVLNGNDHPRWYDPFATRGRSVQLTETGDP